MEEETREAKTVEDDRVEGWRESKGQLKERDRLAHRECSEMNKVMNEEIHLAREKKKAE